MSYKYNSTITESPIVILIASVNRKNYLDNQFVWFQLKLYRFGSDS